MKRYLPFIASALLTAQSTLAFAEDHPIFSTYPAAKTKNDSFIDYEKIRLPVSSVDNNDNFTPLDLIGDVYRHTYEIRNVSTLKVFDNYLAAAKQAGFKPLFSCVLDACGSVGQVTELGAQLAIHKDVFNNHSNPYYWIGEKQGAKGKVIAAWFIGSYNEDVHAHQVIVETEPLENNLIKVDASYAGVADNTKQAELSADEKAKDHIVLPRYPGARLSNHKKIDTEKFTFPVAINATNKNPISVTGDLFMHQYEIKNTSSLKVYENYRDALTKAGFSFVSHCALAECGSEGQARELGGKIAVHENVFNANQNPYFLLAKKNVNNVNLYVALFVGADNENITLQQVILEEKSVATGLITVNADSLKQQIDAEGKALIYGIYFDTGKASIKPESKPTLDAIADLLKRNPSLLLYVVGHTDDTGSVASNLELSKQRAKSVVDTLVSGYQIAANRLQAEGVGPYAPASSNTTDSGKQKNRRVELVKRLQ